MLKLSVDQVEEFDPKAVGWTTDALVRLPEFPEVDGRSMVFQRDFYTRGDDRMVIEWDRGWTLRAIARNGHWFEGDMTFERFQELIREAVLNGQTGAEWLAEQFEFELCSECCGNTEDHTANPDMFGNWHAWCTFKAPRLLQFGTTTSEQAGEMRQVRLEWIDSEEAVATADAAPSDAFYSLQVRKFSSANEIPDEDLRFEAQQLLRDYREKKHNES